MTTVEFIREHWFMTMIGMFVGYTSAELIVLSIRERRSAKTPPHSRAAKRSKPDEHVEKPHK
jgi:hypothetical protein